MRTYLSRHPELISILALFAAVFLLGGLTFDSSQSQDVPTPVIPPGFRGVEPPVEGSGENTRGPAPVPTSTENDLGLLYSDDFDGSDPNLTAWITRGELLLVAEKRGHALRVPNKNDGVQFIVEPIDDIVVSARLKLNTRGVEIRLRESDAGFYAVRILARGQVQLFRNNDILTEVSIPKIKRSKWRNVRVSVIEDMIRVTINNTELVAIYDTDPLPAGRMVVSKLGSSVDPMLMDRIRIWLPRTHIPWLRTEQENDAILATTAVYPRNIIEVENGNVPQLISALNACPAEIHLAVNGTYILTDTYTTSFNHNVGLPIISQSCTIEGHSSTIRRESTSRFRIFHVTGSSTWLTLNNVTLSGGNANVAGGSAISIGSFARVDMDGVNITDNTYTEDGDNSNSAGPSGIRSLFSTLNLSDSIVADNHTSDQFSSGAILISGGTASISGSEIRGNTTVGAGGGIFINSSAQVTIVSSEISDNSALSYGGGISISTIADNILTIDQTKISGNVSGYYGGGIHHNFGGTVTITNSIIADNSAENPGSGIYGAATLSISTSCIHGNIGLSFVRATGSTGTVTATNNWWGRSDGPSGVGPGNGDAVGENVDYSNWLTSPPTGLSCNTINVCNGHVNANPDFGVRAAPTLSSALVTRLPNETLLHIVAQALIAGDRAWYSVTYLHNGVSGSGFMRSDGVEIDECGDLLIIDGNGNPIVGTYDYELQASPAEWSSSPCDGSGTEVNRISCSRLVVLPR